MMLLVVGIVLLVLIEINFACELIQNTLVDGLKCAPECKSGVAILLHPQTKLDLTKLTLFSSETTSCRCYCYAIGTDKDRSLLFDVWLDRPTNETLPFAHVDVLDLAKDATHRIWITNKGPSADPPRVTFAKGALSKLEAVKILYFNELSLPDLPDTFLPSKHIDYVSIDQTDLKEIPKAFAATTVKNLYFKNNFIKRFPSDIFKSLQETVEFGLMKSKSKFTGLDEFPYGIFEMKSLKIARFGGNKVKNVILTKAQKIFLESLEIFDSSFIDATEKECQNIDGILQNVEVRFPFVACIKKSTGNAVQSGSNSGSSADPSTPIKNEKTNQPDENKKTDKTNEKSSSSNIQLILGVSLGSGAVVVICILCFVYKKKRNRSEPKSEETERTGAYNSLETKPKMPNPNTGSILVTSTPYLGKDDELLLLYIDYSNFNIIKTLAKGAFGEVWLASYNNVQVAIKKLIFPSNKHQTLQPEEKHAAITKTILNFAEEIKLMTKLEHPRVVKIIGCSWTNLYDFCAILEFLPNGDLCSYLAQKKRMLGLSNQKGNLLEETWKYNNHLQIALDVLEGLIYMHSLLPTVIHRDLKSRNILLAETYNAKLTDFGISRELSVGTDDTMTGGMGTVFWMAPELLIHERLYTEKVDIYSFGVVLTELDTLEKPYYDLEEHQVSCLQLPNLVASGKIRPSVSNNCPALIKQLIEQCLNGDPTLRPTAGEIYYQLESQQHHLY